MISNFIKQSVTNTGTGVIQLGNVVDGFAETSDVFPNNSYLFYCLVDGMNKETGVGKYISASNSVERVHIFENIIDGILHNPASSPLTISTSSLFYVGNSAQAQNGCLPSWHSANIPLRFNNTAKTNNLSFGLLDVNANDCLGNVSLSNLVLNNSKLLLSFFVSNSLNEVNNFDLDLIYSYNTPTGVISETTINKVVSSIPQINTLHKITFDLGSIGKKNSSLAFNLKRNDESASDTYSSFLRVHSACLEYKIGKFANFNEIANIQVWE